MILLTGYAAIGSGEEYPANIDMVVDKPVTRLALRQAVVSVMADGMAATPYPEETSGRLVDSEKVTSAAAA